MRRLAGLAILATLPSLGGCALPRETVPAAVGGAGWRDVATDEDRARLRNWRSVWLEAIQRASRAGHGADIAREGALLQPDAALDRPLPPSGAYRCRTIKLGSQSADGLEYIAYPSFSCRITIEDGVVRFARLGGSQRPIGVILPDNERRHIFLGTLQLGDETSAFQYGRDRERDLIAAVERIDETRWRLVFPSPYFESLLDVIELVPSRP